MVEDIFSVAPNLVSNLTKVIAALGGIIFFYLIFNIINLMINHKKEKQLKKISSSLEEIKRLLKRKK